MAKLMRTKGNQWCELEVTLDNGRLSISGSEGRIVSKAKARKEARDYWTCFFEDNRNELHAMNDRMGTNYRTAKGAAQYVLDSDGEFHGLDVHRDTGDKVFLTESCGQIIDTLSEWFPEVVPYLPYHLNDMKSNCVHQEARGETWTTHPNAECPDCGFKLGSAWLTRELPPEVVAWANSLGKAA